MTDADVLSSLSPARRALLDELVAAHLAVHPSGRSIIGFDGPEGGGKKQLADHLGAAFEAAGFAVFRTEIDAFHTPLAGRDPLDVGARFRASFDDAAFLSRLVEPFRAGGEASFVLGVVDPDADAPSDAQPMTAPANAIVIVHGPFLLRPELEGAWDRVIWVDADAAKREAQIAKRLGDTVPAAELAAAANAERLYERELRPASRADVVIDNTDASTPVRKESGWTTVQPL